jgi:hypothetical protein
MGPRAGEGVLGRTGKCLVGPRAGENVLGKQVTF